MSDTTIGISRKNLIACLYAQGFHSVSDGYRYDKRMTDSGKTVIMRFEIEQLDQEYCGQVKVLVRIVGEDKFQMMGVGDLRRMRIAPHGKILGIGSIPNKQRFDRKKHRAAIANGEVYNRGD